MIRFIPNMLTGGRLVLTVIFLVMILYSPGVENKSTFLLIAFILFVVAGLTDIIDGKIARMYNVTSKFGRMIDPLADKILVCGTFFSFAIIREPKLFGLDDKALAVIHWSVFAVLIAREAYVTILRHLAEAKGINFAATISGKIKMFLQSFAIGTVIIKMAYVPTATWGNCFTSTVFLLMVVITVISGITATRRRLAQ
ncbi:MAG: CDP-alcohol phosphatidyltransferase family protein [Planctomycetota bacterium]|jgi:CDP-diacylglycerol--glycerol-3-phosphate 3-phosphatidyltransferase